MNCQCSSSSCSLLTPETPDTHQGVKLLLSVGPSETNQQSQSKTKRLEGNKLLGIVKVDVEMVGVTVGKTRAEETSEQGGDEGMIRLSVFPDYLTVCGCS